MGSLMKKQAERFLREKKRHRRWLAVFLSLSLLVTSGTFAALRMNGHAMDHTDKVLNCRLRIHEHTEECFDSHGELTCGKADYVIHTHNGKCMDEDGNLVCKLPERKAHVHDSSCYAEERVLTCRQEETAGHQHSEACYIEETGDLICTLPEHQHSEGCYGEDGSLICGQEEHQHGEECFAKNRVLACTEPESSGHTHSDSCYETKKTLICGQEEAIPHTHSEECYDENGNLTCGLLELEEHEHGQGCFDDKEKGNQPEDEPDGSISGGETSANEALKEEQPKDEESNSEKPQETKAPEQKPAADDNKPGETVSGGSVSENTASENAVSDNTVSGDSVSSDSLSGNTLSGNNVSGNSVSGDSVSGNALSGNNISGNGVSGNSVSENMISLSANVGGTTITLSGPESSFEKGKELSIQAEEITSFKKANEATEKNEENEEVKDDEQIEATEKDEEAKDSEQIETDEQAKDDEQAEAADKDKKAEDNKQIEAIDEAVKKLAEEKEKEVKDYQAFDIKLLADGEEVQPLGPVEVKFSGKKVEKAVENKKTDVEVLHVGEDTGKSQDTKTPAAEEKKVEIETEGYLAQDMKATATEEKEVVIETEHFSVYVYVNLEDIFGKINVTVQHWGENIEILDGTQKATEETDDILRLYKEGGIDKAKPKLKSEKRQLYTSDEIEIPNEYYKEIEELSKVCKVDENDEEKRYTLSKVWIGEGAESNNNKGESWTGTYQEYINQNGTWKLNGQTVNQITLSNPSIIRFWYTPKEREKKYDATFYDYDITTGKQAGSNNLYASEKGVNSSTNYESTKTTDRLGIGQFSSGNVSPWTLGAKIGNKLLNKGQGTNVSEQVVKGIVSANLVGGVDGTHRKGNLQFNVTAPKGLLDTGTKTGTTVLPNYKLGFNQKGDTYILDKVYNSAGQEVEKNLSEFWAMQNSYSLKRMIYSNNFWPMDKVEGTDPLMGKPGGTYKFVDNNGTVKYGQDEKNDDIVRYSSTEGAHNWHFGMRYSVDFTIGDYTGPMEYYFRGDDDFWLFVDGELAVDIGGVHRALGESLDLWTWMREHGKITYDANGKLQNKNQQHTLDIFFMERGGTGSCCYMQFTVPNTKTVEVPEPETTEYSVTKDWDDDNSPYRPESIKVRLVQEWGEEGAKETRPTEEYQILSEANNWTYHWEGLPLINGSTSGEYNYSYKVEEVNLPPGYTPVLVDGKLTNQLKPVKVEVEKKWQNDEDLKEKYRPESITLQLYANGEPYEDTYEDGQTKKPRKITLNAENDWKGVFEGLPEYCNYQLSEDGNTYTADRVIYSVKEIGTDGTTISDNEYLTTEDGVQYKVTYDRVDYEPEPTPTPTASAPNKAPAMRPPQEGPGLDEEYTEEDSESGETDGESSESGETSEEDSENAEVVEDTESGEADGSGETFYGDEEAEGEAVEEVNAQASYNMQRSAPAPAAETDSTDTEQRTVATLTVTNTLVKNFKVVKESSTSENGTYAVLSGAEFTLTPCDVEGNITENGETQTITSGTDGTIAPNWENLTAGQYYLMKETKAPAGYMLSRTRWIIQIVEKFGMKEIGEVRSFEDYSDFDGPGGGGTSESISVNYAPGTNPSDGLVLTYTFKNDEIYELPSTGGTGIYWYMIGGMFLMMGASLILYRNRSKKAVRGC